MATDIVLLQTKHDYEIYHIVYVSNATSHLNSQDIYEIEKSSITHNKVADITGILSYKDHTFIQFLEGTDFNLKKLFSKLQKDSRHTNLDILRQGYIPQRQFYDWHMKYIPINSVKMRDDFLHDKLFKQSLMGNDAINFAIESSAIMLAFKQANYYP